MLEVGLLGTGGMMPLPRRYLTSLMVRYNGTNILIDCGEGTQVALKEKGWSPKPIDVILITHFHADHVSGLPGLFLTMGNAEKTTPLTIVGPKGIKQVVESLRIIAPELPFEINFIEITGNSDSVDLCGLHIDAFKVNHNVLCYGYSLSLDRAGRFDADRAKELDIPLKFWNRLQKGEVIKDNGNKYTPEMVMGPSRKGLKVTYVTDSRPCKSISEAAVNSDLFICEGMYGEPDTEDKARDHKHMTFREAATLAKEANVKEMWLTHFSPSLVKPKDYVQEARNIFENSIVPKDGFSKDLLFDEE